MRTFYVVILLTCSVAMVFAQSAGDYRSVASGNWSVSGTWQTFNGSIWGAAASPPTGSEVITVLAADSVYVDVAVTITDTLKHQGIVAGGVNLTVGNGGVYQYDRDAGSLPAGTTWATGSTYYVTGITATAPANRNQNFYNIVLNTPNMASNRDLGFDSTTVSGNITVLASGTGSIRWQMGAPLAGDTIIAWLFGDIIQQGGQFSSNGTSNANSHVVIHHYGNTTVTGGNFSVSRGSQGGTGSVRWYLYGDFSMSNATTQNSNVSGARFIFAAQGTQTLELGSGNTLTAFPMEIDSGTTVDMGLSKLRGSGRFVVHDGAYLATAEPGGIDSAVSVSGTPFTLSKKAGYFFNGVVNQVTGTRMPDTVSVLVTDNPDTLTLSDTVAVTNALILRSGVLNNTHPFTLGPDASLGTGHANGIAGIADQLVVPFDPSNVTRFDFVGLANQVTSAAMPDTIVNLTIDNPDTVFLSLATHITGILRLKAGIFDNTIPFTLGPSATISYEGGMLRIATSAGNAENVIPESFFVEQNYPNPFNPATTIRYGISEASNVSAVVYNMLGQKVTTVFEGRKEPGTHQLRFNASNLPSGVYLLRIQAGSNSMVRRMVLMK
ncbi:MAG: T9SS type A sorting domain-containing protein [Bacteroidota bacterium]